MKHWLLMPIDKADVEKRRDELLLKFAFMSGEIKQDQIKHFLLSFKAHLKKYLSELHAYYKLEKDNLPLHGRLSFEHGMSSCKTTMNWCSVAFKELNNQVS